MTQLPSEAASDTHTYKYRPWVFLLNIFSLIVFAVVLIIPATSIFSVMSTLESQTNERMLVTSFLCAVAPLFALLVFFFLLQIVTIFQIFFTYIRTTPEGFELKNWPYRHIWVRWSEVDRLGKFSMYDMVYLKSYEVIGTSLSYHWPLKFLNFFQTAITLSSFNGWPNGPLAADLKHYAPRLFEKQPEADEQSPLALQAAIPEKAAHTPEPDANVSGISKDHRVQAALSHAMVLVAGIGLLVPLVIYYTQRKNSAYLAYHALQAFFYQLAGTILLGFIFPSCLIGVILIPLFGTAYWGNANTAETSLVVMMLLVGAVITLTVIGNIAFTIYGVVGAVKAYQGKEFRYAIIGKRIERRI